MCIDYLPNLSIFYILHKTFLLTCLLYITYIVILTSEVRLDIAELICYVTFTFRIYGFYDECKRKYSVKLWKCFVDVFNCLPVGKKFIFISICLLH